MMLGEKQARKTFLAFVGPEDAEAEDAMETAAELPTDDIYRFQKSTPIEKLKLVIKKLVKEKDEEKEKFNGVIAGLLAEKEKKIRWIKMLSSQIEAIDRL
ncbi:hypothetical protein HanIR_Chr11g0554311 [Helianthus annuus]|nr:hypothetical protein HanIR_Chr11g0554311 [Helianthus annuus]